MNQPDYIESREGGYWIHGTRVSLDSVVYRFLEGLSPENIQADCLPTLTLDQVYGAISHYLANRAEIDRYLQEADKSTKSFGSEFELNTLRRTEDLMRSWHSTKDHDQPVP